MTSTKIKTNDGSFRTHKTYSPEEILSAGGATAFSRKADKSNKKLIDTLKKSAIVEPFSNEEWNNLSSQLDNDK